MLIEWILIKSLPRLRLCRIEEYSYSTRKVIRRVDEMTFYVSMNNSVILSLIVNVSITQIYM